MQESIGKPDRGLEIKSDADVDVEKVREDCNLLVMRSSGGGYHCAIPKIDVAEADQNEDPLHKTAKENHQPVQSSNNSKYPKGRMIRAQRNLIAGNLKVGCVICPSEDCSRCGLHLPNLQLTARREPSDLAPGSAKSRSVVLSECWACQPIRNRTVPLLDFSISSFNVSHCPFKLKQVRMKHRIFEIQPSSLTHY